MAFADEIQRLRDCPPDQSAAFRQQIERARQMSEQLARQDGGGAAPPRGVDRSGELTPLPRPVILRTVIE